MSTPSPTPPPNGKKKRADLSPAERQMHVNLGLLALAVLIDVLGFSIIIPLAPDFVQSGLHTGPKDARIGEYVGWLTASYALMQFVFAPIWGALSDRIGRKPILIGSLVGDAVFYALFGLSAGWLPGLFMARILAGIFSSASLAVAQAYAADITPPHLRAMALGYVGAAFGVGFVFGPALGGLIPTLGGFLASGGSYLSTLGGLGPLVGGFIASTGNHIGHYNLSLPLYVAAALAVINIVYIRAKLPEPERETVKPSAAPGGFFARLSRMADAVRGPIGFLYLLTFAVTFAFGNLEGTFTTYLKQHFGYAQNSVGVAGGVFAYAGVLIVLVQGGAIRPLVKRYGEGPLVVAGIGLMAVGFLLFPLFPVLWAVLLLPLLLICVGNGLNSPALRALLSRRAAANVQGATLGLSASFDSLARAAGPAVGGVLYKHYGQGAPYWFAGGVMSVCFLVALLRRREMTPPPVPS